MEDRGEGRRRLFDSSELRLVLLKLISDQPRHGYDLIRAIEELSGGAYVPSPGVVYPALAVLQDLDHIEGTGAENARKAFAITPSGTADLTANAAAVKALLLADPPYGAEIEFDGGRAATGWNAPALAPWLERSLAEASEAAFGAPPAYMGEGGSIPFMAMLGEKFPQAQFVVTGVLGPHSNAHGPNEFLHIPTAKRVTAVVARVLADHGAANQEKKAA